MLEERSTIISIIGTILAFHFGRGVYELYFSKMLFKKEFNIKFKINRCNSIYDKTEHHFDKRQELSAIC
jgi:hypothetical protein